MPHQLITPPRQLIMPHQPLITRLRLIIQLQLITVSIVKPNPNLDDPSGRKFRKMSFLFATLFIPSDRYLCYSSFNRFRNSFQPLNLSPIIMHQQPKVGFQESTAIMFRVN